MLARSAKGLYWMGRYLERTEHFCRLLRSQTAALVDRPIQEIHSGWDRIYNSMNRQPPLGGLELIESDDFTLADSYILTDDLTFERTNPDSVWSCLASGRENARQMRHCISGEMWTHLNLAYHRIQKVDILEIWRSSPETFFSATAAEMDTFVGVATATMYRDEGWHFMQLGRFIEGAQLASSLLLGQLQHVPNAKAVPEADWMALLRDYNAVETYNRRYGIEVKPNHVLDLIATDPYLPRSLCRSLDRASRELNALGPGPNEKSSGAAQRLSGRVRALIHYDWPDSDNQEEILHRVSDYCRQFHLLVSETYFDYPTEALAAS